MKMKKNIKNKTNKNNSKKQSKLTSWIDQRNNDVQFNKRFGAYVLDWIIGGIFTGLPAVMMYGAITGKSDMFSDLYVFQALGFEAYWAYLAGALCIVFALFYYVYVPYKIYPGQTLAKKWLNIKIVMEDDSAVTLKALLLRQVVGLFLLESGSLVVCGYIRQMITLRKQKSYLSNKRKAASRLLICLNLYMQLDHRQNPHKGLHWQWLVLKL